MRQQKHAMQQEIDSFYPENRQQWRDWLWEHHDKTKAVWLIYPKKKSSLPGITYDEAVEEALCFGWIDGTGKSIDNDRLRHYFCPRKPDSGWSQSNKKRIERLTEAGLMTPAGLDRIEQAKQNGSWYLLDDVEALVNPPDFDTALRGRPDAYDYFQSLSRTSKQAILRWIVFAKRPETRQNRIREVVELAAKGQKPTFLQPSAKRAVATGK